MNLAGSALAFVLFVGSNKTRLRGEDAAETGSSERAYLAGPGKSVTLASGIYGGSPKQVVIGVSSATPAKILLCILLVFFRSHFGILVERNHR